MIIHLCLGRPQRTDPFRYLPIASVNTIKKAYSLKHIPIYRT